MSLWVCFNTMHDRVRCCFSFLRGSSVLFIVAGFLSACHHDVYQGVILRQTPRTVLYSYVIADGMARGRFMRKPIYAAQVLAILNADHEARTALRLFHKHPSRQTLQQAGQKVEDFIGVIEAPKLQPSQIMR
ncbi:MAG: hypothetical protein IJ934_00645 [Acetobacter sp.]|nr:hypothetical protein [Acetobacter sp.]